MTHFHARPGMSLYIHPHHYRFMPHPLFPDDQEEVYVIEGGEALIYQVQDAATRSLWALKVMKPSYRGEHIERAFAVLTAYKVFPGFSLTPRICLTRHIFPDLIAAFPDLEYAIVMPWFSGRSWASFKLDSIASANYTCTQASHLALATSQVLWHLEIHHLAHTDIAGGNIIIAPDFQAVELLDIEGLYVPGTPPPNRSSQGSPGYQHRHLDQRGQWRPEGDRFAGAILLTEMLTWWDPLVRAATPDDAETLFQPHELQTLGMPRWRAVRNTLWAISHDILELFDYAWASHDLAQCPDFATWTKCLAMITR